MKVCSACGIKKDFTEFNKGHIYKGKQYLRSMCKSCHTQDSKLWQSNNKERHVKNCKDYKKNNPEKEKERAAKWNKDNAERAAKTSKAWRENNKEYHQKLIDEWRANHPENMRGQTLRRRKAAKQATPSWVNKQQLKAICKEAIELEKLDGIPRQIDHVIPLQHEFVCGLNIPANLQILTAHENLSKSNKFTPYVESEGNPNPY